MFVSDRQLVRTPRGVARSALFVLITAKLLGDGGISKDAATIRSVPPNTIALDGADQPLLLIRR